jgi:hypothetical protein
LNQIRRSASINPVTAAELRTYLHRAPFVPFDIVVPGRSKKIRVPHPDFMSISPSGRIAHVWTSNDDSASLDIFLITAVEMPARNGKARRSRRE